MMPQACLLHTACLSLNRVLVSLRLASLSLFTTLTKLRQNKRKPTLPEVTYTIPANGTSAPHDTPAFGFGASAQTLMKENVSNLAFMMLAARVLRQIH